MYVFLLEKENIYICVTSKPYSSLTNIESDWEKSFTNLWMNLKAYSHHDFKWGGEGTELPCVAIVVKLGRALTKVITHLWHYLQVCNTHFAEVAAACNVPCKTQTQNATECDGKHFRAAGERRVAALFSASYAMQKIKKYYTVVGLFFFAVISSCRIQVAAVRFV